MKVIHIDNLESQDLLPYLTLRRPEQHRKQGIFIAEGEKVVLRLLKSQLKIISLLITPEWHKILFSGTVSLGKSTDTRTYRSLDNVKIFIADKTLMERIVGFQLHQGIMALAYVPEEPILDDVLKKLKSDSIIVALDGLVNAENVGVIIRNSAAFGADLILTGETSSSPYLRRAVRNSMGAVFQIPILHTADLRGTLQAMRDKYGIRIIAAYLHEDNSLFTKDLPGTICIVFGNENKGISDKILEECDEKIAIPMMNQTDSLNVASASAVFLYEARKQRALSKSGR